MKPGLTIGIFLLLLSPATYAQSDQGRIKGLMHAFVMELSQMSPYLATEEAFTSPQGKATVASSLKTLERKVQNPPAELKDTVGFRISFGLLADHIAQTKMVYEKGEYEYARSRLNGMTNLCAACHTQTPRRSAGSPFSQFDKPDAKPSFEQANFLFVLRRYDEALGMFDKLVRGYPDSGLPSDRLNDIYRKKLAIFGRVLRDPNTAVLNLNEDLKNEKLPLDVKQNIKGWIADFKKWKDESKDPSKLSTPELINYVSTRIPTGLGRKIAPSSPDLLNLLRLSGLLYEKLYSEHDPSLTQQLLYYLAMCERSLSPLDWYSLNEIYLKECVVRYPKQAFSKRCFEAYRSGMAERYSNLAMPDYIHRSINALKDYL